MYSNISGGMKKMFIAQIGIIVCTVIAIIPIIGAIIGGLGALVFAIISLIGLYAVGKEVEACKKAFILTIVNAVLSLLTAIPVVGVIISIVNTIISFLITYLVCTSLAEVLRNADATDIANLGTKVWKISFVCAILSVIFGLIALIPLIGVLGNILNFFVAIAELVAGIMYLIFLYKGSNHLA